MTENFDVKKHRRDLYAPKAGRFVIVDVPTMTFLMIDGAGDPNVAQSYSAAVRTLYAVSYAARGIAKRELGRVHTVAPLEALWSADDPTTFLTREKSAWRWTAMIAQPDWITPDVVERAVAAAASKSPGALDLLRFEQYAEGLSVQTLHIGSYDDEGPTLARMHDEYLPHEGLEMTGRHHEIYLSDARKVAPEKLKTVLRQPVRRR